MRLRQLEHPKLITTGRFLVLSFIVIIALGAGLLSLPASTVSGISLTDAIFTSASAVCVTGLIVKSTPDDFTLFGKVVIALLIQIGGLGYMTMSTFIAVLLGRRIGFSERVLLKESLNLDSMEGIIGFTKKVVLFVAAAEGAGAALMTIGFSRYFGWEKAAAEGLFHSVSAFNNAGFSLFNDSLMAFSADAAINATVSALVILGGLGFIVVVGTGRSLGTRASALPYHLKVVLSSTAVLIPLGAALFYMSESRYLFVGGGYSAGKTAMVSAFSSISARTAGFNTTDFSALQPLTLFLVIILMIIGASPGSTGGGIKTTTFMVIMAHIWCTVRGRGYTVMFRRRVPQEMITKALLIFVLSVMYITLTSFIIIDVEHTPFEVTLFEVVSAFGTVGLSVVDGGSSSFSATFTDFSKLLIAFTMLVGRVGPLTLFAALLQSRSERYRYPEGGLILG